MRARATLILAQFCWPTLLTFINGHTIHFRNIAYWVGRNSAEFRTAGFFPTEPVRIFNWEVFHGIGTDLYHTVKYKAQSATIVKFREKNSPR